MKISLFLHSKDNEPKPLDCTWQYFVEQMSAHDYTQTDKFGCPAFSPAEYKPGAKRGNEGVVAVWMFVIDLDEVTEDEALSVLAKVHEMGLASLAYTTWSHATDPWRMRVAIPLSKPVPAKLWGDFWAKANAMFHGLCDPQCKDPARLFFGPFAPAGTEDENFIEVTTGVPLDVDSVIELPTVTEVIEANAPTQELPAKQFAHFAKQYSRKTNPKQANLGQLLLQVAKGESFAKPGNRDNIIFQLSCVLAERFIDFTPESIAEHFFVSLQLMATEAPGCPTVADVAYKIGRQQTQLHTEKQEVEQALDDAYADRIREAFKNGRSDPYTEEELQGFGEVQWIIQKGKSYYFFFDGAYQGPYHESEAWCAALRELAPARTAGVRLTEVDDRGREHPRSLLQLVADYGTVAEAVEADLGAQRTTYDIERRTIVEAACPRRALTARYHADIAQWLLLLGRDKHDKLLAWVKYVTRLDLICRGLYLTGPKGIGKSLLAYGLARLWTTAGPADMADAFSNFNDGMMRCPITLADETLPKDWRGAAKHAEMRRHTQERIRSLRRKFLPVATLRGATRSIVTANNQSVLETTGHLTRSDAEAVAARILHLDTPPTCKEAADFLASVDTSGWVDGDMIAEHALWLAENFEYEPQGRFLIEDDDEKIIDALIGKSGVNSAVCMWLVSYLLDPVRFDHDARSRLFVRIKKKRLLVNVQGLLTCWDSYVSNERCPSTSALAGALEELSDGKQVRLRNAKDVRTYYRAIKLDRLIAWAESTGYSDAKALSASVAHDTEIPGS